MSDFNEFGSREKAGWADAAIVGAYITHFGPVTDSAGDALVGPDMGPGQSVLDLCCGQGTLTARIAGTGAETTGLDFSPEMIALARAAAPSAEIVEGDATAMPFEDGRFDRVVCNFGMMHIADQPKALTEIRRVLKPGGHFTMATWAGPAASPAFGAVFGAIRAHADFSTAPPQPDLFAFADPDQARGMMEAAGLEMTGHDMIESAWTMDRPEGLFDIFLTATVGARMVILSQSEDTIGRIANTVAAKVRESHADGDGYAVPVVIAVVSARAA